MRVCWNQRGFGPFWLQTAYIWTAKLLNAQRERDKDRDKERDKEKSETDRDRERKMERQRDRQREREKERESSCEPHLSRNPGHRLRPGRRRQLRRKRRLDISQTFILLHPLAARCLARSNVSNMAASPMANAAASFFAMFALRAAPLPPTPAAEPAAATPPAAATEALPGSVSCLAVASVDGGGGASCWLSGGRAGFWKVNLTSPPTGTSWSSSAT